MSAGMESQIVQQSHYKFLPLNDRLHSPSTGRGRMLVLRGSEKDTGTKTARGSDVKEYRNRTQQIVAQDLSECLL